MFTHCSQCQEPLPVSARGTALQAANSNGIPDRLAVQCIPCTAKGSREVRTALLIEAWDRFTALRTPPKVSHPLYFAFEARKGGSASLLLLTDDLRSELKIEAELADIREAGMQPVVLALLTPGRTPLYVVKGFQPPVSTPLPSGSGRR